MVKPNLHIRTAALVLAAAALPAVASCGPASSGRSSSSPAPSPSPVCHRGPAMVQVENSSDARPLSGIQGADIVYEYLTEGGITRLTAIYFHPAGAAPIEPVRSARLITLRLQRAYQGLVFYSGASDHVQGLIWSGHVPAIRDDAQHTRYFQRDGSRFAPHNLFTEGRWLAQGQSRAAPCMAYRPATPGAPKTTGTPAAQVSFAQTPSHLSTFEYRPAIGAYRYSVADTGVMVDTATGQPIHIRNLVVIQVAHHPAGYTEDVLGATGIDFDLAGTGAADVFTGGRRYHAAWSLADPGHPLQILDSKGAPLSLPAGLTWIALVDPGTQLTVS